MIFIYICENDFELRSKIEEEINDYIGKKKYQMKVQQSTSEPMQLLEKMQDFVKRGLYFIDTDFSEIDGILLGKEIRKRDARGFIVFITSDKMLILKAFKYHIEVVDYIMKGEASEIDIFESIKRCLDTVAQRTEDELMSKWSKVYHSGNE